MALPNTLKVDYSKVPAPHMVEGVRNWVDHGVCSSNFLRALFMNDFLDIVARADEINLSLLPEWARFLYNSMPAGSFGSEEKFYAWVRRHGDSGEDQDG